MMNRVKSFLFTPKNSKQITEMEIVIVLRNSKVNKY